MLIILDRGQAEARQKSACGRRTSCLAPLLRTCIPNTLAEGEREREGGGAVRWCSGTQNDDDADADNDDNDADDDDDKIVL